MGADYEDAARWVDADRGADCLPENPSDAKRLLGKATAGRGKERGPANYFAGQPKFSSPRAA